MLNVTLLTYTPQPEKTVAAAAKLCYSSSTIDNIMDGLTPEKSASFVEMLSEIGHESPIEHAYFTFGVEGVSRTLLAQVTRHRMASFSVQSQRYVVADQFEYIIPPEIESDAVAKDIYLKAMEDGQKTYDRLADILKEKHKKQMIADGMDEKSASRAAEKKAIEDARFVLPNACATKMVITMNARSLLNFFRLRCCNRAQWEIHEMADRMLALCLRVAPNLFKNAGPSCAVGACSEGKMNCGKIVQVRDKYSNMKIGK
ncbi:MAG: FAD-dependent thymidylate synthase [Oscillospiraceae bacterium]|nr:FAD-dependent thymidylate synthase [Oscillospiraceae bacterium]